MLGVACAVSCSTAMAVERPVQVPTAAFRAASPPQERSFHSAQFGSALDQIGMAVEHDEAEARPRASTNAGVSSAWTTSQVAALAVTGLASSHSHPFVRLLYEDRRRRSNSASCDGRPRILSLESGSSGHEAACSRQRGRDGKYTATWAFTSDPKRTEDRAEVFNVAAAVDFVELQVWNRFATGFDVFLEKATFSLHQLQEQSFRTAERDGTNTNATTAVATGARWFPLQASEGDSVRFQLSLQVACRFLCDPKALRIRDQLHRCRDRSSTAVKKNGGKLKSTASAPDADQELGRDDADNTGVVDPTFVFTPPNLPIEWASIASTNLRHIFFHSDVERLANFRELVLYGDLEQELEEDEDLQVDEGHVVAFSLCQYSAQYLDHCVERLSERLHEYRGQHGVLIDSRERLTRKRRSLKAQRKRLQQEHDELELLVTTYQRVLEKNGSGVIPNLESPCSNQPSTPNPPIKDIAEGLSSPDLAARSAPSSPTATLSSKKPVFLKTWEERERERRLDKELSKAQRIGDEKQRLRQRVLEREERDLFQTRVARLTERRRERAARCIHTFIRGTIERLQGTRQALMNGGATRIQASWRRFMNVKRLPSRLETYRQAREMQLMATSELETRQWLAILLQQKQEEARAEESNNAHIDGVGENPRSDVDCDSNPTSPSKIIADELAKTWRRLHRVFILAHAANGADYRSLFSQLDLRKDDVIDRAEMRLGAQSFRVRMDRKLTRALIALVRTKCGAPSRPLQLTFDQFMTGFELSTRGAHTPDNKIPGPWTARRIGKARSRTEDDLVFPINDGLEDSDLSEECGHDGDSSEDALVLTVRALRSAIHEAATAHLRTLGKSSADYRAFREALTDLFLAFDVDKDGQLDQDELLACMESFGLRIDDANSELLRELFSVDRSDGVVRVSEFISFVLGHTSVSRRHDSDDSELGAMSYRLRSAILDRATLVQDRPDNVKDAVRCVFRTAYKRPGQRRCSIRDFIHVLESFHLGLTRPQLARVVMRLDRDGDRRISFDELLVWLRVYPALESAPAASASASCFPPALLKAKTNAKLVRFLLASLAVGTVPDDPASKSLSVSVDPAQWTALFRRIDRNDSSKIHLDELQTFLAAQNLAQLRAVASGSASEDAIAEIFGPASSPRVAASTAAQKIMALLDVNGNGVVTLEEWLEFVQRADPNSDDDAQALVDTIRTALKTSENSDPARLLRWFSGLSGAIPLAASSPGDSDQVKVRAGEFKNALRRKLGGAHSVPLQAADQVVKCLDADGSGWITTSELHAWVFPPRDLEEILRLVIKGWQQVRHKMASNDSNINFAASLYQRFDADSNDCLAMAELRRGLESFGTVLTADEVHVLLLAFDLDGDGCWSKAEFMAFVNKLFPTEIFSSGQTPQAGATAVSSTDKDDLPDKPDGGDDVGVTFGFDDYDDQDLLLLSASPFNSSSDSVSLSEAQEEASDRAPVEYSEDFDDDG